LDLIAFFVLPSLFLKISQAKIVSLTINSVSKCQ